MILNSHTQEHEGETIFNYEFVASYHGINREYILKIPEDSFKGTDTFESAIASAPPGTEFSCADTGTFTLVHRGKFWYLNGEWVLTGVD